MPGPPSSPYSAIVRPWRLPSASSTCHDMKRSPPPVAAVFAASAFWARSSLLKMYVAVNLPSLTSRFESGRVGVAHRAVGVARSHAAADGDRVGGAVDRSVGAVSERRADDGRLRSPFVGTTGGA